MTRYRKIGIFLIILIWSGIVPVYAEDYIAVQVSAAAAIQGNDFDSTRLVAIAEAKKQCIKKALRSDLLAPAEYQKNAEKLESLFFNNPTPYVDQYFIENEEIIDDGQRYRVTVSANIRKNAMKVALIENKIGNVLSMTSKPSVMVMVRERFETRISGTRTVETILVNMLQEKGFRVVDPEQRKLIDLRNRLFYEGTGNMQAALQAAMSFKADYLVFGEAVVTSSGPLAGTDLKARYANLNLKIVETSSGRIIATKNGLGKTKHIDELTGGNWALEESANKVGPKVLNKFESLLKQELMSGTEIIIDLYGLEYPSQVEEAAVVLKGIENVGSVFRRFYFSGVGQFEVKFKGDATDLAEAVVNVEIDGQPLKIIETLPRYLRVRRTGGEEVVSEDTQKIFCKYLKEKYKHFDLEKAREQDKELIEKINKLAQNQKINDKQKKQLYVARKEIEEKREELLARQRELEKRKKELEIATEQKRKFEDKYKQLSEELEKKRKDKKDRLYKEEEKEVENLHEELGRAKSVAYTASRNYSNVRMSNASSAVNYITAINQGVNTARQIGGFISSFF